MPTPAYIDFKSYWIVFHDQDEYNFAVAAAGGDASSGGVFYGMSPNTAATMFGIPIPYPSGNLDLIPTAIVNADTDGITPATIFYVGGNQLLDPDDDDGILVPPVDLGGSQVGQFFTLQWAGICVFMGGQAPTTDTPTTIPQRRWIGGYEVVQSLEGGAGITGVGCRDASRTIDGIGFAARGQNTPNTTWVRLLNEYGAFTTRKSWERLYFRPRIAGAGIVGFWRCHNSVSPAAGAALVYNTTGGIDLYTISSTTTLTLVATGFVPDPFTWVKIDVFLQFPSVGGESGRVIVVINGVLVYDITDSTGANMDTVGFHANSEIGKGCSASALGNTDAQVEYDLDDWMNAEWPEQAGVLFLDSVDFLMGSHIRRVWNIGGSAANYLPANVWQITNQGHNPQQKLNSQLTSTTASALVEGNCDLPELGVQDKVTGLALGVVAAIVGIHSTNASSTDGQIGYDIAAAGPVMATVNEVAGGAFNSARYQPSGLIVPDEVTPMTVRYTKSADAASVVLNCLQAVVEEIGIWGAEDLDDPTLFPTDISRINNIHNCQYPQTPYAIMGPTPVLNVNIVGGTYVGNGTQQDIALPDACHMLFIRNNAGGGQGIKWFACGMGGHFGTTERVVPNFPIRVWFDPVAEIFKFTVCGTDVDVNALAATYQYIAFCDPGMRFCCAGSYNIPNNVSSRNNILQNSDFTPNFIFVQQEILGSASTNQGLRVKGPGNTGITGSQLNGAAQLANFGSFSAGIFTSNVDNHPVTLSQLNYLAFRTTETGCNWIMCQILSYVGDGAGSKVIPLTPNSGGRFPLFALVVPTSGAQASIFRDPSHTANNSARFDTLANTTTGITAGAADSITVGSSLNANGVIYNVFVIPGSFVSWQNGTFFPPNCDQPEPWFNPPMVPPEVAVMGDGGVLLGTSIAITMLRDVSGLYTLVSGKASDTIYNRISGASTEVRAIPNPSGRTAFISG